MNDMKHTPGPWKFIPADDTPGFREPAAVSIGGKLMFMPSGLVFLPGETEANARLIAAAPEGLEIAEDFLSFARSNKSFVYPPGSLQKLEQFIAKARGEA